MPTRLQYNCYTIAQYTTPPPDPRFYAIHHTISGEPRGAPKSLQIVPRRRIRPSARSSSRRQAPRHRLSSGYNNQQVTHTHTHTPTENNTLDTDTHTRPEQHPKPSNDHLPQTLNNARRWRDDGACHLPRPGGWPRRSQCVR